MKNVHGDVKKNFSPLATGKSNLLNKASRGKSVKKIKKKKKENEKKLVVVEINEKKIYIERIFGHHEEDLTR